MSSCALCFHYVSSFFVTAFSSRESSSRDLVVFIYRQVFGVVTVLCFRFCLRRAAIVACMLACVETKVLEVRRSKALCFLYLHQVGTNTFDGRIIVCSPRSLRPQW